MSKDTFVGKKAHNFTLRSHMGEDITLGNVKNKNVVLVFYCADDSPDCNEQLGAFRDSIAEFQQVDAAVFGINDALIESHKKYAAKYKFNFSLLSDPGGKIGLRFGAWHKGSMKRTVVILDKDRVIRYHKYGAPSAAELVETVKGM